MERAALDDVIRRLLEVRRYRAGKQVQLAEWEIRQLCAASKDVLMRQPNLLELQAPIKIAGNLIHHSESYYCTCLLTRSLLPCSSLYSSLESCHFA